MISFDLSELQASWRMPYGMSPSKSASIPYRLRDDALNVSRVGLASLSLIVLGFSLMSINSQPSLLANELLTYPTQIRPILEEHCYSCHGGGERQGNIALDSLGDDVTASPELWHKVLKQMRSRSMPPLGESPPTDQMRDQIIAWIKSDVFHHNQEAPDPGMTTIRRLNRLEYKNTVRDLIGVEYDTPSNFPADDTGHGFDNIADVLTISPLLLEKYLAAAKEIVTQAVPQVSGITPRLILGGGEFTLASKTSDSPTSQSSDTKKLPNGTPIELLYNENATANLRVNAAHSGKYQLELNLTAAEDFKDDLFDYNKCRLVFKDQDEVLLDREFVRQGGIKFSFTYDRLWDAGDHQLSVEVTPLTPDEKQVRRLRILINNVALIGPVSDEFLIAPPNYEKFFPRKVPSESADRKTYASELLRAFASKAYRRPVDKETVDRLVELAESIYGPGKLTFESGIAQSMAAVLASPRFLFREEGIEVDPSHIHPWVDQYSLASRLSYFLWSTMPDEELLRLAERNELRDQLDAQIQRMMNDPRSTSLFQNFVGQWLQSRAIDGVTINAFAVMGREREPDPVADKLRGRFRELRKKSLEELSDGEKAELEVMRASFQEMNRLVKRFNLESRVRQAMRRETEMVFEHILREDRPLTELIDSNYTFLNEPLAKFYEVKDLAPVTGDEMRRVELPEGSLRGGILTQGTFLAVTSNPSRTSPVKRGLFILENVLGASIAAPPPNIPSLEDSAGEKEGRKLTLRESLEIHRSNAVCSSCHNKMDPLGLAFENFNALGRWRDRELSQSIDAAGQLSSGEDFTTVTELKKVLVENHRREIYYCIAQKMLTYALGRGLSYSDDYALDEIVDGIEKGDGKAKSLLNGVIHSNLFLKTRHQEEKSLTAYSLNEESK